MPSIDRRALVNNFEAKKTNFKYQLNELCDDLFGFMLDQINACLDAAEIGPSRALAPPPLPEQQQQQQQQQLNIIPEEYPLIDLSPSPPPPVKEEPLDADDPDFTGTEHFGPSTSNGSSYEPFQDYSGYDYHDDASDCSCDDCLDDEQPRVKHEPDDDHQNDAGPSASKRPRFELEDREDRSRIIVIGVKCTQGCDDLFEDQTNLDVHLATVHNLNPHPCLLNSCPASFTDSSALAVHLEIHHKEITKWPCAICKRVCMTYRSLLKHNSKTHQEGLYKCSKNACTFMGTQRIDVHRHLMTDHRNFFCDFPECTFTSDRESRLKVHQRIHRQARPFTCNYPDCGQRFVQKGAAIRHIRTRHFLLPETIRRQKQMNIEDNRDPTVYLGIDETQL